MTVSERYTYSGVDARGQSRGGDQTLSDLSGWVEKKWQQGWPKLTVQHVPTRTNAAGQTIKVPGAWPIVAEIGLNAAGIRMWWADVSTVTS